MINRNGKIEDAVPFLKWAGGKRQLLPELARHVPAGFSHYCEPFLGGGALLFHLQPERALVNDINAELINVYEVIRDDADGLIAELKKHRNNEKYYYRIRKWDRTSGYGKLSPVQRASRIIYLNRTCYNGLFRVNSKGHFNVPFGRYRNPGIVNEKTLRAVSAYLNKSEIDFECGDFLDLEKKIKRGTFVYVDPPYHPVSKTSSFTSYADHGFAEADQVRLKEFCERLVADKNCYVLISNSYTGFIRKLYSGPGFEIRKINAVRSINSVGSMRGKIPEALITGRQKRRRKSICS